MKVTFIDGMNYRYNNPTIDLTPDEEVVRLFLQNHRERNVIEQFTLWASMSKENTDNKLVNMINENVKIEEKQNSK